MVGSSSTMAMRRDIAGEYSPSRAHRSACHRFARIARRVAIAAARVAPVLGLQCLPEHGRREIALGVECAWTPLPEPRRSSWLWVVFIALLVALGTWELGRGAWIQAKAWLAQSLIAHAWTRTLSGERQAKPWPWADTWPVARLTVPRLGIERYVLAGADGAAMAFAPGHG